MGAPIVALLLVGLSACSPSPRIYARSAADGDPSVLICESGIDARELEFSAGEDVVRDRKIWTIEGKDLAIPQTVLYGQVPQGWSSTLGPHAFPGDALSLSVTVIGERDTKVGSFQIENLREDEWVTPDGHYFSGDCESAPE